MDERSRCRRSDFEPGRPGSAHAAAPPIPSPSPAICAGEGASPVRHTSAGAWAGIPGRGRCASIAPAHAPAALSPRPPLPRAGEWGELRSGFDWVPRMPREPPLPGPLPRFAGERENSRAVRLAPCARLRVQSAKADFGPSLPRIHSPQQGRGLGFRDRRREPSASPCPAPAAGILRARPGRSGTRPSWRW